jgi:hypothetical protein
MSSCGPHDSHSAAGGEKGTEPAQVKDYTVEKVTVKEFMRWCADEDNRLSRSKEISEMRYKLSYLPPEAMAFLELRKEPYDLPKFRKLSDSYSEMTYFTFRIEVLDGSGELLKYKLRSPAQYDARVKYMSFDIQNDLYLVQGKDTLIPGLFQFERIFEVAPYANVMFAFDNKRFNRQEEFTIIYNDKLFGNGYVKFNYRDKQLFNLPNITEL